MIDITINNKLVTESEISEVESQIGSIFPEDYKAFLLKSNGAYFDSTEVFLGDYDDDINVFEIYSLKYGESNFIENNEFNEGILDEGYFNIGSIRGGNICMSLREENYGVIYVYYSTAELEFAALSFSEFLEELVDYSSE
ncbi:SMI1/KNR4 family protein [Flavobacterium sp. UBA4197]|uniref:SMI1/KNR4 family protein n=1 Tax=Flavobacterium sp. UBA4197 TaxID=1946546 RepID=UPI00257F5039|nr:SMI1/KNR4 family protein [Flavobacterium sp. UBA4197]